MLISLANKQIAWASHDCPIHHQTHAESILVTKKLYIILLEVLMTPPRQWLLCAQMVDANRIPPSRIKVHTRHDTYFDDVHVYHPR